MKIYWTLAVFACAVLGAAAVWMGGLNQDEGWYLYAANMVADGNMPYRDFFYTQGPLMPVVYSVFTGVWNSHGVLGARVFTLAIGLLGIVFACALARRLAGRTAALVTLFLLGVNLYHLYYVAIPKTYALAGLFVITGFWFLSFAVERARLGWIFAALSGLCLAFAAGTRISLGAIPAVTGCWLLFRRDWRNVFAFGFAGAFGLAVVYGPFLLDSRALDGLVAAQRYHAARGGFDPVWTVGSFSRLVRWYLPAFIVLGLGLGGLKPRRWLDGSPLLLPVALSFLAVFAVQMLAPFPYEDYQVPLMGLFAVFAAALFTAVPERQVAGADGSMNLRVLLVLGLAFACAFGSPLLERWKTDGQDRFWSIKKESTELAQLRETAAKVEALDPGGTTLLTQDLYLAIETGRKVPRGLEMGPFAMLSDAEWKRLLSTTDCQVAALSGYTFAIEPPACTERPVEKQMEYFSILRRNYELKDRIERFGQNSTTLLILGRKK